MPPELTGLTGGAALLILVVREVLNFMKSRNGSAPVTVTHIQELHAKIDEKFEILSQKIKKLKKEVRYGDQQISGKPKDRPEGISPTSQSSNGPVA